VRVGDALLLEEAGVAAGDRERAVPQLDGERGLPGVGRVLDPHRPGRPSRRGAQAVETAAAEVDEGRPDTPPPQQGDDTVHGVALPDTAEVQLDIGAIEAHRAGPAVQEHVAKADPLEDPGELRFARDAALVAEEAPGLHERAHGHVEGPFRIAAPAQAPVEDVE
jgi:hypothetical protein